MSTNYRKKAYSYRKNTGKALSCVEKIGVRSIFDIIADSEMTLKRKIAYIRHHYVYYEGNYDLFHDENGKATSTKYNLDRVIYNIIKGKIDPAVLSDFNKEITKLRKQKNEEEAKKREEEELNQEVYGLPKYKLDIITHGGKICNASCQSYLNLIDKYMNTLDTKTKQQYFFTKSYKEMRKLAEAWNKAQEKPIDAKPIPNKSENEDFIKSYQKYAKSQGWN